MDDNKLIPSKVYDSNSDTSIKNNNNTLINCEQKKKITDFLTKRPMQVSSRHDQRVLTHKIIEQLDSRSERQRDLFQPKKPVESIHQYPP